MSSARAGVLGTLALSVLLGGFFFFKQYVGYQEATDATGQDRVEVVLTNEGFVPRYLTISKGATVVFTNTTERDYWPASDLHPSHDIYSAFDPMRPLASDETWQFTFDKVGAWGLHDHIRSYYTGIIYVVEK